jgi:hypothetical protein
MAKGVHRITAAFESELCRYTGAPYAVAVDNQSNALFLALKYEGIGDHHSGQNLSVSPGQYNSFRRGCKVFPGSGQDAERGISTDRVAGLGLCVTFYVWNVSPKYAAMFIIYWTL